MTGGCIYYSLTPSHAGVLSPPGVVGQKETIYKGDSYTHTFHFHTSPPVPVPPPPLTCGCLVPPRVVGQRAILEAIEGALAAHTLLPHTRNHLQGGGAVS